MEFFLGDERELDFRIAAYNDARAEWLCKCIWQDRHPDQPVLMVKDWLRVVTTSRDCDTQIRKMLGGESND